MLQIVTSVSRARPSPDDRVKAALWFAGQGFGVFTVWSTHPNGTCRCPLGAACESPGKHPITPRGFLDSTMDADRIKTMIQAGSEPNYGLVCPDGVFALDVDGEGVGRLTELETEHGKLPATLTTRTANGRHIFLRWPDGLPRPIGQLFGYVTRWGSGAGAGFVIGPRSRHSSGVAYEPEGDTFDIATLPETWAHAAVAAKPPRAFDTITVGGPTPAQIAAGQRHEYLRDRARYFRGVGLSGEGLFHAVMDLNLQLAEPKSEEAVRRAIGDVERRFAPDPVDPKFVQHEAVEQPDRITAVQLMALDIPPLRWIVPGLLPEGTTIIGAPPKIGKSWLVYQLAVEVALGGEILGRQTQQGSVLYMALEDGARRSKDRVGKALSGRSAPEGLNVQFSSRKIGEGLEEDITAWLDATPDAAFVAVDTLQKARSRADSRRNAYEVDVEDLGRLQNLFRSRSVALVIVHHSRKEHGDDFLTQVSGTFGITGSADTIISIQRKRMESFGRILVTGRDIDDEEFNVMFEGLWRLAGDGEQPLATEQDRVFDDIKVNGPTGATAIATRLGKTPASAQRIIEDLRDRGLISRVHGGWSTNEAQISLISPSSISSNTRTFRTPDTRAYAREDAEPVAVVPTAPSGWAVPCRSYAKHSSHHVNTPLGWTCDICAPEGAA